MFFLAIRLRRLRRMSVAVQRPSEPTGTFLGSVARMAKSICHHVIGAVYEIFQSVRIHFDDDRPHEESQQQVFEAAQGATIVEGYPVAPKEDKDIPPAFAWTGLPGAFYRDGFKEVARRSPTRPIMRKEISNALRREIKL